MPDWLIWLIVFWTVFGCAGGCRWGWGRYRGRPLSGRRADDEEAELKDPTAGVERQVPASVYEAGAAAAPAGAAKAEAVAAASTAAAPRPETPLRRLQREFVEGTISLEQYEEELDKLDTLE